MKYLTFAFPAGVAGAALLLLRGSVVIFLISASATPFLAQGSAVFGLYVLAAFLAGGLYARVAAGLVIGVPFFLGVRAGGTGFAPMLSHALAASALVVIGPGALSIDSLRFGRRTVRFPK